MGLVVAFFRSPVALGRDQRPLFERALPASEFLGRLRQSPLNLRDDAARIFVAARLASQLRAPLLFVEGWRGHAVASRRARTRYVTGSHVSCLLLRMLQRRRLVPAEIRVIRRDVSRCTVEEVTGVERAAARLRVSRIVGVAGRACPSRRRAARYFGLRSVEDATVYDCWRALGDWRPVLTPEQRDLASALWPTRAERARDTAFEAANWLVHWASRSERLLRRTAVPLEVRLAHRLRPDGPAPGAPGPQSTEGGGRARPDRR